MKRGLPALCLLFLSISVFGQTAPAAREFFLVHEEMARPSMLRQYESTTRELLTAMSEKNADPKVFTMNLYVTPDLRYIYVAPIANWGGIDAMQKGWMTMGETIGKARWTDLMNRGNAAMTSYNEFVMVKRPELSYVPVTPRVKPEERNFVHLQFYYIDPTRTNDTEQVAKDYAALFKAKNIGDPFTVYEVMSGNDLPLWIVSVPARSASDYYANDEKVNATLGSDVLALGARAFANTRKFETRDAVYRRDMSFPMKPAAAAK